MATSARAVPGVVALRMDPLDGVFVVSYDPSVTSAERVTSAIQDVIDREAR